MNLNKVNLIGRVTKDIDLKTLPSGQPVAKFSLATNYSFKAKSGEKVETTQFHNCVVFGALAGIMRQYVVKGQEIFISGRIEYRSWDKKDGTKAYATEIMVEDMQMGQKPRNAGGEVDKGANEGNTQLGGKMTATEDDSQEVEEDINPEDIPF